MLTSELRATAKATRWAWGCDLRELQRSVLHRTVGPLLHLCLLANVSRSSFIDLRHQLTQQYLVRVKINPKMIGVAIHFRRFPVFEASRTCFRFFLC